MKIKKELSANSINRLLNHNQYFLVELKSTDSNFFPAEFCCKKTLVKFTLKKIKISDNLNPNCLKFPVVFKSFQDFKSIHNYVVSSSINKNSSVMFIKVSNLVFKGNNITLISSVNAANTLNSIGRLLDQALPALRLISLSKG